MAFKKTATPRNSGNMMMKKTATPRATTAQQTKANTTRKKLENRM